MKFNRLLPFGKVVLYAIIICVMASCSPQEPPALQTAQTSAVLPSKTSEATPSPSPLPSLSPSPSPAEQPAISEAEAESMLQSSKEEITAFLNNDPKYSEKAKENKALLFRLSDVKKPGTGLHDPSELLGMIRAHDTGEDAAVEIQNFMLGAEVKGEYIVVFLGTCGKDKNRFVYAVPIPLDQSKIKGANPYFIPVYSVEKFYEGTNEQIYSIEGKTAAAFIAGFKGKPLTSEIVYKMSSAYPEELRQLCNNGAGAALADICYLVNSDTKRLSITVPMADISGLVLYKKGLEGLDEWLQTIDTALLPYSSSFYVKKQS